MPFEDKVKAFGMTNMLIESDLDSVEKHYSIKLREHPEPSTEVSEIQAAYFPQFGAELRTEALEMSKSYELFYCLEKTIRNQISDLLESVHGSEWWGDTVVPKQIVGDVKGRIKKEKEAGITLRSTNPIDFTTFGELGEIIKTNWSVFASVFNNLKAVEKIMFNLNSLRSPIAHCSLLAEDEKLRLQLSLRDWFRLEE